MSRWKPSNRAALEEARCYRELNNRQQGTIEALSEAVRCLKSENAKLRRLITGLKYCSGHPTCWIYTGETCPLYLNGNSECRQLERELGIEVST